MNLSGERLLDVLYTKCRKDDLARDSFTLDNREVFGGEIYYTNPQDEALRNSLSEEEAIVGVSSEAFMPKSTLVPIGNGRWKSASAILRKHVIEYKGV